MSFLLHIWDLFCEFVSSLFCSKAITFEKSNLTINISNVKNIGEGAFSVVYKGSQRYDRRKEFAIKKMLIQSKETDQMVQTEVASFKRFNHNNILKLIDSTEKNESGRRVVYLLFPYIRSGSLRDVLTEIATYRMAKPSLITVLSRFNELCGAFNLMHCFQPSYVHQDIKPEVRTCSTRLPQLSFLALILLVSIRMS